MKNNKLPHTRIITCIAVFLLFINHPSFGQSFSISNVNVTSVGTNNCTVNFTATLTNNTGSDIITASYLVTATTVSDVKTTSLTFNNVPDGTNSVQNGTITNLDATPGNSANCNLVVTITFQQTNIVLPVELISFEGNISNHGINLEWQTASEVNYDYFALEVRFNNSEFRTEAIIPGTGDIHKITTYNYDFLPQREGKYYFRLKQVDLDGSYAYSNIIFTELDNAQHELTVFPNPAGNSISLQIPNIKSVQPRIVQILSVNGRQVKQLRIRDQTIREILDISDLYPGIYLVRITSQDFQLTTRFAKR